MPMSSQCSPAAALAPALATCLSLPRTTKDQAGGTVTLNLESSLLICLRAWPSSFFGHWAMGKSRGKEKEKDKDSSKKKVKKEKKKDSKKSKAKEKKKKSSSSDSAYESSSSGESAEQAYAKAIGATFGLRLYQH